MTTHPPSAHFGAVTLTINPHGHPEPHGLTTYQIHLNVTGFNLHTFTKTDALRALTTLIGNLGDTYHCIDTDAWEDQP